MLLNGGLSSGSVNDEGDFVGFDVVLEIRLI